MPAPLEVLEPVQRQAAVLHAGRHHDRARLHDGAVVEGDAVSAALTALDPGGAAGHGEAGAELHRLHSPRQQRSAQEMPVGKPM